MDSTGTGNGVPGNANAANGGEQTHVHSNQSSSDVRSVFQQSLPIIVAICISAFILGTAALIFSLTIRLVNYEITERVKFEKSQFAKSTDSLADTQVARSALAGGPALAPQLFELIKHEIRQTVKTEMAQFAGAVIHAKGRIVSSGNCDVTFTPTRSPGFLRTRTRQYERGLVKPLATWPDTYVYPASRDASMP